MLKFRNTKPVFVQRRPDSIFQYNYPLSMIYLELCTALESLPDFLYQCRHNRWHRERIQDKEVALKVG